MKLGPKLIANRYLLGQELGRGASALVLQAQDTWRKNHPVALKIIHSEAAEEGLELHLRREFVHLFRADHPHLPGVEQCGLLPEEHPVTPCPSRAFYVVQELIIGDESTAWAPSATPAAIATLGAQLCAAIAFLHHRGIRHGDIKPANIIVTPDGTAKLVDFGLSTRGLRTSTETISGTPRFLSPQALQGQPQLPCDLYALGITLHTLLTGNAPQGDWGLQLDSNQFNGLLQALTHPTVEKRPTPAEAFDQFLTFADSPQTLRQLKNQSQHRVTLSREVINSLWSRKAATGTTRWTISGSPGSGKTAAGEFLMTRAILDGHTCPDAIRPAQDGGLNPLGQLAFELNLPSLSPSSNQWQQFSHWATQLKAYCENAPLTVIWDDVRPDSPLHEFGSFLERLGNNGPTMVWVELSESTTTSTVRLPPLSEDEITTLIHCSRPLRPLDAQVAPQLTPLIAGNPGQLMDILTALPGHELLAASTQNELASYISPKNSLGDVSPAQAHFLKGLNYFYGPLLLEHARELSLFATDFDEVIDSLVALGRVRVSPSPQGPTVLLMGVRQSPSLHSNQEQVLFSELQSLGSYPKTLGHLALKLGNASDGISWLKQAANIDSVSGNPAGALQSLRRLLEIDSLLPAQKGNLQSKAAAMASALGQFDQALQFYRESIEDTQSQFGMGETLLKLGRYKDAANHLQPLFDSPEKSLPQVGPLLARAHLLSGALDQAESVVSLALKDDEHPHTIKLLATQGLIHYFRGNLSPAQEALEKSYQLGTSVKPSPLVEEELDATRGNLAMVLQKNNQLLQAENLYRESLELARNANHLSKQVLRLTNLGTILHEQEKYNEAMEIYGEALTLAELIKGDREYVRVVLNRANLSSFLGQTSEARKEVSLAIELAKNNGMNTEHAYLNLLLAELSLGENDPTQAIQAEARARAFFEESSNQAGVAESYILQTQIAVFNKQVTRATATAERAVQIAEEIKRHNILINAYLWQALAAMDGSSAEHGRIALTATKKILEQSGGNIDRTILWMTYAIQGILLTRIGKEPEAVAALKSARQNAAKSLDLFKGTYEESYKSLWYRQGLWDSIGADSSEELELINRNVDKLLAINRELTRDHDPYRLLERIIDAAIALSGAERGFIILRQEDATDQEFQIQTARNMEQESLEGEHLQFSNSIARKAMDSAAPITSMDALGDERFSEFTSVHHLKLRSVLCLPLNAPPHIQGALYLDDRRRANAFSQADVSMLSAFGDQAAIALSNARLVHQLQSQATELEESRKQIEELNTRLQQELSAQTDELEHMRAQHHLEAPIEGTGQHGMIGTSKAIREVYRVIDRVSDKNVCVTILGESGTGKELVARAIHAASGKNGQFVSVNCGAVTEQLWESELFGHEKGSFTGAVRSKPGLFEISQNGTLFLDEVGDLPLDMQVKLLRVLQQREFRRVGGTKILTTNARIICATNRNLEAMVRDSEFREDLWYRINVVELTVSPLRERREDLFLLINHFVEIHGGTNPPELSRRAMGALLDHPWPGNIRELENELQRALVLAEGTIQPEDFSPKISSGSPTPMPTAIGATGTGPLKTQVATFEKALILRSLTDHNQRVSKAAQSLGLTRAGLYKKISKYDIGVNK